MSSTYRVDLDAIDRKSFRVTHHGDEVLIQPFKTKYAWRDDELPLRSLVTDRQGHVRSAGWPKFFNHGERADHDAAFRGALASGEVEFVEKLDGTLVVADAREGGPALRTRGQATLGSFEKPVRALIERRHPGLLELLEGGRDPLVAGHSLLFEFVGPEHALVIRYDEPGLYFLGAVCKRTLAPRWGGDLSEHLERRAGVPPAPAHALPRGLDEVLGHVAAMSGREGVVARFRDRAGRAFLMKLKAAEYLRLHGHMATLGERGARRIAFLLGLGDEAEVAPAFARLGLDHEASAYALGSLRPYFAARRAADAAFGALQRGLEGALGLTKRDYVERVNALRAATPELAEPHWFAAAIKLYDGRDDDARLVVASALVGEPVPTLRAWRNDPEAALALFTTRAAADDEG
ncbi:MAG TPA: hypothetical protein VFS43_44320 [Polyangiaceae bacterium]|nr:hypothetical protein [Polyangiaceae bacterium]